MASPPRGSSQFQCGCKRLPHPLPWGLGPSLPAKSTASSQAWGQLWVGPWVSGAQGWGLLLHMQGSSLACPEWSVVQATTLGAHTHLGMGTVSLGCTLEVSRLMWVGSREGLTLGWGSAAH